MGNASSNASNGDLGSKIINFGKTLGDNVSKEVNTIGNSAKKEADLITSGKDIIAGTKNNIESTFNEEKKEFTPPSTQATQSTHAPQETPAIQATRAPQTTQQQPIYTAQKIQQVQKVQQVQKKVNKEQQVYVKQGTEGTVSDISECSELNENECNDRIRDCSYNNGLCDSWKNMYETCETEKTTETNSLNECNNNLTDKTNLLIACDNRLESETNLLGICNNGLATKTNLLGVCNDSLAEFETRDNNSNNFKTLIDAELIAISDKNTSAVNKMTDEETKNTKTLKKAKKLKTIINTRARMIQVMQENNIYKQKVIYTFVSVIFLMLVLIVFLITMHNRTYY